MSRGRSVQNLLRTGMQLYRREGWAGLIRGFRSVTRRCRPALGSGKHDRNDYAEWMRRYDTLTDATRAAMHARIDRLAHKPLISIVMPVFNLPLVFLEETIQSVRQQLYANWELCIADEASTDPVVRTVLERHCSLDARIKLAHQNKNGQIPCASNCALELATGEFVALLDHADLLAEQALYRVAMAIAGAPGAGLIYSDEDKIDGAGRRYDPCFKPELNYELLLARNMISHLGVYRTDLVRSLGGFRIGFEGAQDYDLALRVIEQPVTVLHLPYILYHRRTIAAGSAREACDENHAAEAGRKAVRAHLARRNITAEVMPAPAVPTLNRVRFACPSPQPLVSIIIPTRDRADLLGMCLDSLMQRTTYVNYEVIIVDNGSVEVATRTLFERLPKDRFRIVHDASPFNYSALNNHAARVARGQLLCLMNNDIEILTPGWLEEMVSFAMQKDVACVGARLWYPNGRLQHGGCITGLGVVAGHAHKHLRKGHDGYHKRAVLHQSFSVVTAACLLLRRDVFEQVGGLDEQLAIAFNDVDFCLRVREAGYRNVWMPYAEMTHHESATRGGEDTEAKQARFSTEIDFLMARWGNKLMADPAYSANLTLDSEDFSYAWPPRVSVI